MAFFNINRNVQGGSELAAAMDAFRKAWYGLADVNGHLAQMSDAQITAYYGFADDTESAAAKAELIADIDKLQSADVLITGADVTNAVTQMLNQFG